MNPFDITSKTTEELAKQLPLTLDILKADGWKQGHHPKVVNKKFAVRKKRGPAPKLKNKIWLKFEINEIPTWSFGQKVNQICLRYVEVYKGGIWNHRLLDKMYLINTLKELDDAILKIIEAYDYKLVEEL